MRAGMRIVMSGVFLLTAGHIGGCITADLGSLGVGAGGTPSASGPFDLRGTTLRTHQVVAGEQTMESTTGTFGLDVSSPSLSGGSISIDPSAITLTPAAGVALKAAAAFQDIPPEIAELCNNEPLIITVWIAPADQLDAVFDSDQMYVANVTLNESCQATQVDVTPDQLMQSTLDLIEGGEFAIGLGVLSQVTGEVVIDELEFGVEF